MSDRTPNATDRRKSRLWGSRADPNRINGPAVIGLAESGRQPRGEAKMAPTITINLDKKCAECGKGGVAESGICLDCTRKAIEDKPMRSAAGRIVQARARAMIDA